MIVNDNMRFCLRCYHYWKSNVPNPKYCPKCKSPYWNKPRKRSPKEMIKIISQNVINTHNNIIKFSGGEQGVRDKGGIEISTYKLLNYQIKYARDPVGLGAFILNEFAKKHHFMDGNKRTAYVVAKTFMLVNKCHLVTNYSDSVDFILEVAEYNSKRDINEIKKWLNDRCKMIQEKDVSTYLKNVLVNLVTEVEENEQRH
ncbi:MAG TPA: type II toxin-antitoxin system death-on-curing family toxin [Candidatus Pacearchaeota archaeon]|nr:type II toxin-antitoxin system death-on-curing family toxin [Candidatus Pacearchaeota archaeon]